ncbi:hypothetical protein HK100_000345 [Physocladia obscura]|uniref:Uncharacterized protein n=1 Tax=Physocladia obscura TaxID=109957 RepID=A0AAD5T125_9FUNG|nr:hypothetical protein HK100_000345 [Physocladia obscura]
MDEKFVVGLTSIGMRIALFTTNCTATMLLDLLTEQVRLRANSNHTRPITSLAIYPYGPIVISCSLDYTVRMYNLKTFKEVYWWVMFGGIGCCFNIHNSLHLKEKPTGLKVMDDTQLYISTWDTIMVWQLNHINTGFSTINTKVTHLVNKKSQGLPSRLLARSEDGVIRIVSPSSGKVITTSLPLLESDSVKDIAYSSKIDRMFLLVENNEILVIATSINPCIVTDIWASANSARENIKCLLVFEGEFKEHEPVLPKYNRQDGFVFLIAGTGNGQLLFYGTDGQVIARSQV